VRRIPITTYTFRGFIFSDDDEKSIGEIQIARTGKRKHVVRKKGIRSEGRKLPRLAVEKKRPRYVLRRVGNVP